MAKRTYLIDDELLKQFEKLVPQGKRGAWVNGAVARQLEEERKAEIRASIDASFDDEENMKLYEQLEREGAPASDEVWSRINDDWSKMSAEELDREFRCG